MRHHAQSTVTTSHANPLFTRALPGRLKEASEGERGAGRRVQGAAGRADGGEAGGRVRVRQEEPGAGIFPRPQTGERSSRHDAVTTSTVL